MKSPRRQKDNSQLFQDIASEKTALLVQNVHNELIDALKDNFKHVEITRTAEEALNIHMPERYDIVYIDMDIPDMSAKELIQNIKNYDYKQQFIVIADKEQSTQLYDLVNINISNFITKTFSKTNFIETSLNTLNIMAQKKLQIENENLDTKEFSQQQKLAQTGEMIAMIAHQWRQPLSIITTIVGTFRTKISLGTFKSQKDLEDELVSSFTKIEESADFLSKTINDFRNFYKPDNEIKEFNLAEVVEKVCRMTMPDAQLQDITIDFDLDRSIVIKTYENELMQVIINLLNNAKDALNESTKRNKKIFISIKDGNDFVYLNVADNANGIPDEIIDTIFLPYFSTKLEKNGTGLGLHMSKTIIENHMRGELTVKNNALFGGADFCITLNKNFTGVDNGNS